MKLKQPSKTAKGSNIEDFMLCMYIYSQKLPKSCYQERRDIGNIGKPEKINHVFPNKFCAHTLDESEEFRVEKRKMLYVGNWSVSLSIYI